MWETVLARRIQFAGIWILQTTLSFSVRDRRRVNAHTDTCVHTCTQTCEPHTRKDVWPRRRKCIIQHIIINMKECVDQIR